MRYALFFGRKLHVIAVNIAEHRIVADRRFKEMPFKFQIHRFFIGGFFSSVFALKTQNIKGFLPYACWNYLKKRKNWVSILQNTWIRPEDVHHYEPYVSMMKLATRMHALPRMVVDAYAKAEFRGNLLNLLEPGFGPALAPYVLDNDKFPENWFEQTSRCSKKCEQCNYCNTVLKQIMTED